MREKLCERIERVRGISPAGPRGSNRSAFVTSATPSQMDGEVLKNLTHLHDIAESKCQDIALKVMSIVRRHVGTSFFEYDASLCRDGVFYVGSRIAVS